MKSQPWLPGSFTKNYSWGNSQGLRRLHEAINLGFDGQLHPVPRDVFRARISHSHGPDFIPLNFFLFNYIEGGSDFVAVDELVFQAITAPHARRFDHLALFAFNFSHAGTWKGTKRGQRYPAEWAKYYVIDRVAGAGGWDADFATADDIEEYLRSNGRFEAQTFRKIATNLSYLFKIGDLEGFKSKRIERWWVDSLFLALDRIVLDRLIDGKKTNPSSLPELLLSSNFKELSGPLTSEKGFAMAHLLSLYSICEAFKRFDPSAVKSRVAVELPDYNWQNANDGRPQGAVHPTNPRILKTIPRDCAKLAEKVGFKIIYADDLEDFQPADFIRQQAGEALAQLQNDGYLPDMTSEELHKMTRGE